MWPTDLLTEEHLRGWLGGADRYRVQDCPLWILDNSPYPSNASPDGSNVGTLWGFSRAVTSSAEYSGPPTRTIVLPQGAGRGHGFCVLPSGHMIVATSEDTGGNARESWFLVPPNATGQLTTEQCPRIRVDQLFANTVFAAYGARHAFHWQDGIILLGHNGVWKPVTLAAWTMSAGELAALPGWYYNGNGAVSGIGDYDVARQPGSHRFVVQGTNRVWALNLSLPTRDLRTVVDASSTTHNGTTVPGGDGLDWIILGNNVGRPENEGWAGHIAFDAQGNLWKQRGERPDFAFWRAATIAAAPKLGNQAGANPAPDKVLTCPLFQAMDVNNVESVFVGLELDVDGNMWTVSRSYDGAMPGGNQIYTPAKAYRFSAAALAAGGSQMPDRIIELPPLSQPHMVRMAPGFALVQR